MLMMAVELHGVNMIGAGRPTTGVERFALELAAPLVATEPPGHRLLFFAGAGDIPALLRHAPALGPRIVRVPVPGAHPAARHAAIQCLLPVAATRQGVVALLSPMNVGALAFRKQVVVVHDLAWHHVPQAYRRSYRVVHGSLLRGYGMRGLRIACGSENVREELSRFVPRDRVSVFPYGPGRSANHASHEERVIRDQILWVGSLNLRKNRSLAMHACAAAAERLDRDLTLVVVGGTSRGFAGVAPVPGARRLSVVSCQPGDTELESLYGSARVLVCSSGYEGYGLPVAEARARGLPVVSTPVPSALRLEGAGCVVVRQPGVDAFADAIACELRGDITRVPPPEMPTWSDCACALWRALEFVARDSST